MAVDARSVLTFQIDVALHPGAEVVRVPGDIVLTLARLDATQAADAFVRIDAEGPLVPGPVIVLRGKRAAAGSGSALCGDFLRDAEGPGGHDGARTRCGAADLAQKCSPRQQ